MSKLNTTKLALLMGASAISFFATSVIAQEASSPQKEEVVTVLG